MRTGEVEKEKGSIWRYQGNVFKAHCTDTGLAKKVASWRGCQRSSVYRYPDGHMEMDVLFPERLYSRVAGLLELPLRQKNPKRIVQGQRMAVINKKHQFSRNTGTERSVSKAAFGP